MEATSVGTPGIHGNVHGLGIRGRETGSLDFFEGEAASEPSLDVVTSASSPGRAMSTRSLGKTASLVQGKRPGGTDPGRSCRFAQLSLKGPSASQRGQTLSMR